MSKSDVEEVHFKCPKKLLVEFDEALKSFGYQNRSVALHQLMREFIQATKEA